MKSLIIVIKLREVPSRISDHNSGWKLCQLIQLEMTC